MLGYSGILFSFLMICFINVSVSRDDHLVTELRSLLTRMIEENGKSSTEENGSTESKEVESRFIYGNKVKMAPDGHTVTIRLQIYVGSSWKCTRETCIFVVKALDRNGQEERRVTTNWRDSTTIHGHEVQMKLGNNGPYTVRVCVPNNGKPAYKQCETSQPVRVKQRSLVERLLSLRD